MADNELDVRRLPKPNIRERDLDWNVVTLPPNAEIATAAGPDVDVLIHVLFGSGRLTTEEGTIRLAPGALLWLPSRSRPQFTAGRDGLRYLTVNQKWEMQPP